MSASYKTFSDCVHGYITVHSVCVKIIDTPQFQRLRNLKQLGPLSYIYPGASHSRFEHSLGVCHLAGKMVEALRRNCSNTNIITEEEKLCLEIAGLCHDLGHGPFSHTWERFVKDAGYVKGVPVSWKHEEGSVQMFEYLLEQNGLRGVLIDAFPELKEEAIEFIKELIKGEVEPRRNKKYLYQIIANKDNGIDVDRWDYFVRDGHQLNLSFSFDYNCLLESCRVIEVKGEKIICFHSKDRHSIYEMFQARVNLYYKAYFHDVVMTVDKMMIDAFIEADKNGYRIFVSEDKGYSLSEAHDHVEALNCMTDHIFYDILYSTDKHFGKARQLLCRILQRDFYRIVACKNLSTILQNEMADVQKFEGKMKEKLKENIRDICQGMQHCKSEQFEVLMVKADMGVKLKGASQSKTGKINPFSNIYFYEKNFEEAKVKEWEDIPVIPVPEECLCHIHGLVIYKDIENPVSQDGELQKELEDFEHKLYNQLKVIFCQ